LVVVGVGIVLVRYYRRRRRLLAALPAAPQDEGV
jgi:hypothetical protein